MGKKVICELVKKEEIAEGIFKYSVKAPEIANSAKPGQFLEIKVSKYAEPFLRRPISIFNIRKDEGIIEFIFQVKKRGTTLLSEFEVGDKIDIMGPLGFGTFDVDTKYKSVAIIGGGIGIFPLYELTKELKDKTSINVYLGFRNKDLVTCEKEFEAIYTEHKANGYSGNRGNLFEDMFADFTNGTQNEDPTAKCTECGDVIVNGEHIQCKFWNATVTTEPQVNRFYLKHLEKVA